MVNADVNIDPVLLGNELGADPIEAAADPQKVHSSGRTTISVKEAVQVAQNNNLMGLICSSRLLVSLVHLSHALEQTSDAYMANNRILHPRSSSLSRRPALFSSRISRHSHSPWRARVRPIASMGTLIAKVFFTSTKPWIFEKRISQELPESVEDGPVLKGSSVVIHYFEG